MDIEDLKDIECHAIPGAGACGNLNMQKYGKPKLQFIYFVLYLNSVASSKNTYITMLHLSISQSVSVKLWQRSERKLFIPANEYKHTCIFLSHPPAHAQNLIC